MFYVEKKLSKTEKEYFVLYCDVGYRKVNLTFDRYAIAEIMGVAVKNLDKFELNSPVLVK